MTINKHELEIARVARRFREICSEHIENMEDKLPGANNPLERDDLEKQIDAMHELADQANDRAKAMIESYYENREDPFKDSPNAKEFMT